LKLREQRRAEPAGTESPAVCGRGLKPNDCNGCADVFHVARRVRAWIETPEEAMDSKGNYYVARRVRAWIETRQGRCRFPLVCVARRVRAWIETLIAHGSPSFAFVARRVRAWIETEK